MKHINKPCGGGREEERFCFKDWSGTDSKFDRVSRWSNFIKIEMFTNLCWPA